MSEKCGDPLAFHDVGYVGYAEGPVRTVHGMTALLPEESLLGLAETWIRAPLEVQPQALAEPFKVRMISKSFTIP